MRARARFYTPILLALSVVLLAPNDCNITLDNLADLVVTHKITVTNAGPEDAFVVIIASDVKSRTVLKPGGSTEATSFSAQSVLISAGPAHDYLADLKARRDAIIAKLKPNPSLSESLTIYSELNRVNSLIRDYQARGHGSLCAAEFKVDAKGKGNAVSVTLTLDGDKWNAACS